MKPLRDNTPVPAGMTALCRDIQEQIDQARCDLVDLLELTDPSQRAEDGAKLPPQVFHYRDGGQYATGNYVGQFEFHRGDGSVDRVTIGARGPGYRKPNEEDRRDTQGRFLLRAMLEDVWAVPLDVLEEDTDKTPGNDYSQLLAARLAAQLAQTWRKGWLRFYQVFPRRDSRVRGRLDIPREIRQSAGLQDGRMAYEVREFTDVNDYNRLFLQACLEAERQYPSLMLHMRKQLPGYGAALQALQNIAWVRSNTGALLNRTRKKITNPIYRDYETLRIISRAFLRRQGGVARSGESGTPFVTGIFLDISRLWERFLLEKVLPPSSERHYQTEHHILRGNLRVVPDFYYEPGLFYQGSSGVVLDAKYKFKWGDTLNSGGTWTGVHDDIYQVLAYMLELRCPQGGVIFPVDRTALLQNTDVSFLESLEKLRIPIGAGPKGSLDQPPFQFWRLPFAVPGEVSDYSAFLCAMDQEAEWLGSQIASLLFQLRRT